MPGPLVPRDSDRHHQVGDQPEAAEEGGDREAEAHEGRIDPEVLAETAGHAPEHPVLARAEQPDARRGALRLVLLSLAALLVFSHAAKMPYAGPFVYRESPLGHPRIAPP